MISILSRTFIIVVLILIATPSFAEDSVAEMDERFVAARALLLEMQQDGEWPYEGVYRVRRQIPIGYRVGGTAISADALLHLPGLENDEVRRAAIARATAFIAESIAHREMAHNITGTYDVRGWGYVYGLRHLLAVRRVLGAEALGEEGEAAIAFFLEGIMRTTIPRSGGWNYARRAGFDSPGPSSPFMTACTLHVLLEAEAQGYDIDEEVREAALDALDRARTAAGGFVYSGTAGARRSDAVPGAVGRMLAAETALMAAGRGSVDRVRGALDAFFTHWDRLEERRAKSGTHEPPFGVAPYYFFYAHHYAAKAIAMLPRQERAEYVQLLERRIMQVRDEDGSWNDRVFRRSAAYGTAMAVDALRRAGAGVAP